MSRKVVEHNIIEIYRRIKEQSPPHHFEFVDPFWVLITTMLSHRTKDEVTDAASRSLYNRYRNSRGLASASYDDVRTLISRVGFSKVKAQRVIDVARIIGDKYGGKVPGDIEKLVELPGVGRKTANVVLADSFGIPAIAVDTHVQRIATRLGVTKSKNPEDTEHVLEKIVPRELWLGFNPTLVEFGKKVCRPIGPRCTICGISEFCDYYVKQKKR